MNLKIRLQPKQALYYTMVENSPASWLGYGGSRGGAKSGALRRIMVKRRLDYPNTTGQILRRVWDDIQKNHLDAIWREFPDLLPFYRAGEHAIYFPNGSKLYFDSAENATDVERKGFGPEFMDIGVDQAEQFSEKELKQLKTTCRWPGMPDKKCKFMLFFNPGGQGASFLQRVFYTHKYEEREVGEDFSFLQAFGWDNVEWVRSSLSEDGLTEAEYYTWDPNKRFQYFITRSQYGREMNALPAHMRPGQLLGDFKRFAGQYFSIFDPEIHVWPADEIDFKPWWMNWISLDWGFQHHAVAGWHTQAGEWVEEGKTKRLVITYKMSVPVQGLSERAWAEQIVAVNDGDKISHIYGGHDLWAKKSSNKTKEAEMSAVFKAAGMPKITHAVIDRVEGWRFMYRALDECEWVITNNCSELVDAIPTAVFNEKQNNEDVLKTKTKADDILDMARYGLYSQYAPKRKPVAQELKDRTAHLTDPTSRSIQMKKLLHNMGRKKSNAVAGSSRSFGRFARYGKRVA